MFVEAVQGNNLFIMKLIRNKHISGQNAVWLIITVAGVYNYHLNLNWLNTS